PARYQTQRQSGPCRRPDETWSAGTRTNHEYPYCAKRWSAQYQPASTVRKTRVEHAGHLPDHARNHVPRNWYGLSHTPCSCPTRPSSARLPAISPDPLWTRGHPAIGYGWLWTKARRPAPENLH